MAKRNSSAESQLQRKKNKPNIVEQPTHENLNDAEAESLIDLKGMAIPASAVVDQDQTTAADEVCNGRDDSGKFKTSSKEEIEPSHSDEKLKQEIKGKEDLLNLPDSSGEKHDIDKIPVESSEEVRRNEMLRIKAAQEVEDQLFESNFDVMKDYVAAEHDLKIFEQLGKGAYGRVYRADFCETEIAVKIVYIGNDTNESADCEETALKTLKKEKHKNIILLQEAIRVPNFQLLLLEKCDCTLTSRIPVGGMPEKDAKEYFRGIISGLNHMHQLQIGHGDVKLDNILLLNEVPKIIDFGHAVQLDGNLVSLYMGTPLFMAPEVHKQIPYDVKGTDIWSTGCVLWMLLTATPPFAYDKKDDHFGKGSVLYENIITGKRNAEFKGHLSKEAADLIDSMLCVDPSKRITVPEVASHDWLKLPNITTSVSTI